MDDINENIEEEEEKPQKKGNVKFECPNCGLIDRENVLFLCNTCESRDLIEMEGMYVCPSCLKPGDNFECLLCGSTHVVMKSKKK